MTVIEKIPYSILLFILVILTSLGAVAEDKKQENNQMVWAGCGITKKAFMSELAKKYKEKTGIHIELTGGGATKGIREVVQGTINIGGACRATIDRHHIERNAEQIPVAWDALVVIVNKDNPVDNISFKQLRQIYNGDVTNWKQLGGHDADIDLYVRKGQISGVGRTLRELVFADYNKVFTNRAKIVKSSGPAEKAVVDFKNAITTTGVSSARRRDVKILKLEGKEPSYENIKNGSYVLYRPLYLVIKKPETNQMVLDFVRYATGFEGVQVIRNTGTVPYADALVLVMKQIEQYKRATQAGL